MVYILLYCNGIFNSKFCLFVNRLFSRFNFRPQIARAITVIHTVDSICDMIQENIPNL